MVADKLQRQEEERIQCSPTSNIDNMVEEEMDISTTHHKRKVAQDSTQTGIQTQTHSENADLTPAVLLLLIVTCQCVIAFDCLQFEKKKLSSHSHVCVN